MLLQVATVNAGVELSDGATGALPLPVHRGSSLSRAQELDNASSVRSAWSACVRDVSESLARGLMQGWDLHPGQIVARVVAHHIALAAGRADAVRRMRQFVDAAGHATRVGTTFDDAASARGVATLLQRGVMLGAWTPQELASELGVSLEAARDGSLDALVAGRRAR
jgi:hypothetical protein